MTDVDKINRNKELCERMPYLVPRNVWTGKIVENYDYSYIEGEYELPSGWLKLFLMCMEDIRQPLVDSNYLNEFRFSQIKEKYNTMRLYNFGASKEVHDIISKYEYISQFVCQKCGKPATKETIGWITSYCDDCIPKGYKYEEIKFEPVMHITRFSKEGNVEEHIDCSDIWRRLYGSRQSN